MATKLVISADALATLRQLPPQEEAEISARNVTANAERLRRGALTPEEMADEDIVKPMFDDAVGGNQVKLIKAVALALLDGLNQDRAARGATPISAAQLRSAVRNKLGVM